jgi:hypothetical protein
MDVVTLDTLCAYETTEERRLTAIHEGYDIAKVGHR